MLNRRALLAGAAALPLMRPAHAALLRPAFDEVSSLREAARSSGRLYGCAASNYALAEKDLEAAVLREAGILVAEYEMKRKAIEPEQGHYNFGPADKLANFANAHGLKFRGHTLVWYHSNPPWLEDAVRSSRNEKLFTGYIALMMKRYRGRVHSWDVVNEAIRPQDSRSDGLRKSFWLETFGPSYIDTAFHAAREADPAAQLVYNDYGCEQAGTYHDHRRADTLKLLEGMKARGVPIDALGMQGHLKAFGASIDQRALARFLDEVKAMGLRILVTEHDVNDRGGSLDIAARDSAVADTSARFLDVMLSNDAVDTVLTWGLSDRLLRSPSLKLDIFGYRPRMLPLDEDLRRTAMWRAMKRAFANR